MFTAVFLFHASLVLAYNFETKEYGFRAYFPSAPKQINLVEKTFVGKVPHYKFFVKNKTGEWAVDVSMLPEIAMVFSSPSSLYEKAKKALLKDVKAKEISFQRVYLDQLEGRELHYKKPEGIEGKVRFFLKDKKLYTVVVEIPKDKSRQRFFRSFRLIP